MLPEYDISSLSEKALPLTLAEVNQILTANAHHLDDAVCQALRRSAYIPMDEWVTENRGVSITPFPGRWDRNRMPHLNQIMSDISSEQWSTYWVMCGTQCGKTELLINTLFYYIGGPWPTNILYGLPRDDDIKDFVATRLRQNVHDSPGVRGLINLTSSRHSPNTQNNKSHNAGQCFARFVLGSSAAALAQYPVRVVMLDEIDKFRRSVSGEGDPVEQVRRRGGNYLNPILVVVSSPTDPWDEEAQAGGRIHQGYLTTDQNRWHCPCPKCGRLDYWTFRDHVRWPQKKIRGSTQHDWERAYIQCRLCSHRLTERQRAEAIDAGQWVPACKDPADTDARGYQLGRLQVKVESVAQVAKAFLAAKKNLDQLRVFHTTVLGEPFTEPAVEEVSVPQTHLDGQPALTDEPNVLYLTLTVDLKRSRLDCLLVGHGARGRKYVLDWIRIPGNITTSRPWEALNRLRSRRIKTPFGRLTIHGVAIDTGYAATEVYDYYFRPKAVPQSQKLWLVKGSSNPDAPIISRIDREQDSPDATAIRKPRVHLVGTQYAKDIISHNLMLPETKENSYTFDSEIPSEFFRGLQAEHKVRRIVRGQFRSIWVQRHELNEPLDLLVYTEAVARLLNYSPQSLSEKLAGRRASKRGKIKSTTTTGRKARRR